MLSGRSGAPPQGRCGGAAAPWIGQELLVATPRRMDSRRSVLSPALAGRDGGRRLRTVAAPACGDAAGRPVRGSGSDVAGAGKESFSLPDKTNPTLGPRGRRRNL